MLTPVAPAPFPVQPAPLETMPRPAKQRKPYKRGHRESWQRPDPRRYYRFWRERFTTDEIKAIAEAIWGTG